MTTALTCRIYFHSDRRVKSRQFLPPGTLRKDRPSLISTPLLSSTTASSKTGSRRVSVPGQQKVRGGRLKVTRRCISSGRVSFGGCLKATSSPSANSSTHCSASPRDSSTSKMSLLRISFAFLFTTHPNNRRLSRPATAERHAVEIRRLAAFQVRHF